MKVTNVFVEELENAGCNNGNYPEFTATLEDGTVVTGVTCRCGNGCSGTERLPKVGEEWVD